MTAVSPRVPLDRIRGIGNPFSKARERVVARLMRREQLPRPPAYLVLCATVTVLNVVGLVMILSASSVAALSDYGSSWYFFNRQLLWALIGFVGFIVASRIDYRLWRKFAPYLLVFAFATLTFVLVGGKLVSGSRRWLVYGPLQLQPSEIAKLALLVCGAEILTRRSDRLHDARAWRPVVAIFLVFAALVMKEPDLASTIVLGVIVGALLIVGGVRAKHLAQMIGIAAIGTGVLSLLAGYRRARMFSFLHPGHDVGNTGYQLYRSLIAIGSGGLNGVGLGAGRAKWFFLPNAHTDFIFAIIGEELGFIGCLLVLGLFVGLGLVGLRIARRAPDRFGMLMATGVTAWIVGQAAINLGAVIGVLPVSGVPLPFLSVGGTSLVITMFGIGVVANIAAPDRARVVTRPRTRADAEPSGALPRLVSAPVFALLTGGGTGGHTYPAIAVAQELERRGHSVRFVGGKRGIEGRVVPAAGFEIDLLPGRGLQRRLTLQNVEAIWGAASAVVRAIGIVRRHRPRVVVGFGGYASFPCVFAARLLRVPVVVHEQDAAPGLANRLGVRIGARPAISLPNTPLPHATLTGNPVRAAFAHLDRRPRVAPDPALVAVFGGAQGARTINRAALGCYDAWRTRSDLVVRHVCGPRNLDECETELARVRAVGDALEYELVGYEEHMDVVYRDAALAVCRSGAGTIAELTAVGLPAVLVPLPGAPSDHQTRNAQTLERAGAAVMLRDDECDPQRLDKLVTELLGAPDRLAEMGVAARGLGRPDAAERLADLVEEHARG